MYQKLHYRLAELAPPHYQCTLRGIRHGIEKENLRVSPEGAIAQTPHQTALGSKLTHPFITTDYSEALIELITLPYVDGSATLEQLNELQRFVYECINPEILWAGSMPCPLTNEEILIAEYGRSNLGRMKTIYRRGLDVRYGKKMQAIAGIHFNFSLPKSFWIVYRSIEKNCASIRDFINHHYFALCRNFLRYDWLLNYLFGSTAAIPRDFIDGEHPLLERLDNDTLFAKYGCSLRMSNLGYQNTTQAHLAMSFDSLNEYVHDLHHATTNLDPNFSKIPIKNNDDYQQLNQNILQIENEYYSAIRPKRTICPGERPTHALQQRGVEYIEVRALDLNPMQALGIDSQTTHFMDIFLLFCLLHDSPMMSQTEINEAKQNSLNVCMQGRQPNLSLTHNNKSVLFKDWAAEIFTELQAIANLLDQACNTDQYSSTLALQSAKLEDADKTPSAAIITLMKARDQSYTEFTLAQSKFHANAALAQPLPTNRKDALATLAKQSLEQQIELEQQDKCSFEEYLADYFSH